MIPVPNGPTVKLVSLNNNKPQFIRDGKAYEIISIRRRIGGVNGSWKELDFSKLTDREMNDFVSSVLKTLKFLDKNEKPQGLKAPHSFTLHFKDNPHTDQPFLLDRVTFIESKGDQEQTHQIELSRFSQETLLKIRKKFHPLNNIISTAFHRTTEPKPPLNITPTKDPNYKPIIEEPQDLTSLHPVVEEID